MAGINFDATQVAPNMGFSPVEKGKYPVAIIKSEFKPTANGAGKILEFNTIINGGANHGRNIMFTLNWENQSAKAVEIGRGQFSALCHAVGVLHVQDTQQLHNILFEIEVDVTPDGKYNNLVSIHPIAQAPVQQQPVQQPVYQQPVVQAQVQPQQVNPMAQFEAMGQPQAQPVYQQPVQAQPVYPQAQQGQPEVPDWIKNQQAAAQGQPMGNG